MGLRLQNKIEQDFKDVLKHREGDEAALKLSVLRLLLSQVKNFAIDHGGELSDEEMQSIIKKAVKEREDSISQYSKAGRVELAEKEERESRILKTYLPEEMSADDVEKIVSNVFTQQEKAGVELTMKNFGVFMQEVMRVAKESSKSINGSQISELVKKRLH